MRSEQKKKQSSGWFNFCTSDNTNNRDVDFVPKKYGAKSAKKQIIDND